MKIQRIKLQNIGPYINSNEMYFDVSDSTKRMVLIGGKNGAGKTTLFNAIKLCLYGCVAYGYETANAKYYAEVEKIINSSTKLKKNGEAEVLIELLFDDGIDNDLYTFSRKWKLGLKRISETFTVLKNGRVLGLTERADFENYLHQLLPPNMFRFYFFDGERLSDFVFNGNNNSDFKNAFLRLCNLDTMEIIKENFRRISRTKTKESESFSSEYDKCLDDDNLAAIRVENAEEEFKQKEQEILLIDEQLASLEKTYSKGGGISQKEWKSMQEQISKEEARREEKRKWLKDISNNVLPFIILRDKLVLLKDQIIIEHKAQVGLNVKTAIDTAEAKELVSNILSNGGVECSSDFANKIIYEICEYSNKSGEVNLILNLSEVDRLELVAKINSLIAFNIDRIKEATDDINASLNCVKRIRAKMERSSIDNYDDYLKAKSELNEKKAQLSQELLELDKELQELRANKAVSAAKLAKAKTAYETVLKKQSINDVSARALLAFNELQDVLYESNIRAVEKAFEEHFKLLINKDDLIDGIHIDSNLNVLPYRNKHFKANEIRKSLLANGDEYVIAQIGLYAYEMLKDKLKSGESEFDLPVEIKQQLSAGEKQIFVMALYQALAHLNKINVPYIIDTPFARIDGEHREKILEHFFKRLKGQIIILSTDEEIVANYKNAVSDIISNTYVLNHTVSGSTEIKANSYFGD